MSALRHLSIVRLGLAASMLVLMRAGWIRAPWPGVIWPVFASMFMFRLGIYLYDLKDLKLLTLRNTAVHREAVQSLIEALTALGAKPTVIPTVEKLPAEATSTPGALPGGTTSTPALWVRRLPSIGWSSMRTPAIPARMHSRTIRRTAMIPP